MSPKSTEKSLFYLEEITSKLSSHVWIFRTHNLANNLVVFINLGGRLDVLQTEPITLAIEVFVTRCEHHSKRSQIYRKKTAY